MANSNNNEDDESWDIKFRQDEEMEFFTELALHETERWVSAVTRKKFSHPDDFRKSLENGVLLCECLNNIKPGSVKRINKLPTPIAGLDNINVFLSACKKSFGLNENQLFDPCDLEDLSQRAIADSQYLKQEVDRRAINVAITVYWLGKSIEHTYSGPQLDQSAFAAFVRHHGKDLISDNHLRNESLESNEQSSANSSHDSYSKVSNNDCLETKNSCDSSYESYGSYTNSKESELSFNLEEDENMPASNRSNMRRYASAGSLYSTGGYQFSVPSNSSANIDSRNDSAYQSNPDLVNNHHRRGSSTDSMDSSSYYGNHSRQSSTEGNVDIPTRTLNSQRKVSTSSMDPLQFVKSKPSQKLAEEAEKQIQAAQEVKKVRTIIEKEDDDWYQNLSSWKHKRRRASAATYQRVEETDQIAQEEEEKRKTKTYSQMKEDREKRKSTGMLNFYPIDDDDDDFFSKKSQKASNRKSAPVEDTIAPARAVEIESAPSTRRRQPLSLKDRSSSLGSDSYVKYSDTDVADWAKNDEDDNSGQREGGEKGGNSVEDQQDKFSTETSYDSKRKVSDDNKVQRGKDTNNEEDSVPSWKRTSARNNEHSLNSGLRNSPEVNAPKSTSKISNLLKSFEKKDDDIGHSEKPKKSFEFSVESGRKRTMWQEREKGEVQALKPKALGKEAEKSNTKEKHNTKPKEFVEKNIKINQKPNNAKGFGFVIAGGVDKKKPVVVQKVNIGSAADVCELQMKDQILSVNKRDISHMTQPQVQRIIDDAVRVGQIEVKVKREVYEEDLGWPAFDDDDIEDDAFEMESQKAHPAVIEDTFKPVSFSPVQSQHRSFSPVQSQHRSYSPVQSKHRSYSPVQSQHRSYSPVQSQQRSVSPTQQRISPVTSQQRNSPLLRKERSSASPLTNQQQTTVNSVPAKRPLPTNRIETYDSSLTNKMEDDLESEKMWILQQLGGIKTETNNNVTKTVESESEDESEDDEQQQVKDTKPEIVFSREATLQETPTNVETQVIERPTITRKQQRDPEPDRSVMETVISPVAQMSIESPPPPPKDAPPTLKPSTLDVEGFKPPDILKRWQRGSRSRSDYSSSPNSLDSDSEKRWSSSSLPWQNEFDNADTSSTQRSPNYQPEKDQSDAYPQQYDAKVGQPVTLQIDTSQDSQLIIDPRNQMGYVEEPTIPQYTFHVNIQKPKEVMEVTNLESRERMRDEEQVRNEEERKRIELAEKEEQLRRQEEQIRLERERLKQEQERIQRQKEEMEKRKHIEPEDKRSYNSYTNRNEVNGSDRPSENVTQFSVNINSNQAMPRKLEAVWAPSSNLHKEKERWSREDMLAMNRKPTPLQKKPENESTDDTSDSQVVRSAPTKQDLHNLNAVPKPRYRASEDWKQAQKSDEQNDVQYRRKSEHANSNSHWLVEEAERRRQQDKSKRHSVHTPFMRGPIKPVQDGPANKWLDDSSVIQRHTYTANNVTSPRSLSTRQFSAKPQSQLSQTLPANFNKIPKKEPLVPPKPARSSPNPQSPSSPPSHAEQIMAVSGKQLCSHCNNELGFGAAMVIESLGLYYHVQCFRCCVCQTCLGNGSQGADVRVRVNKLHCRNCYSNDEGITYLEPL